MSDDLTATARVLRLATELNRSIVGAANEAATTLRAFAVERDVLRAERDAYRDDWREIASIVTTDEPEVGGLAELVGDEIGASAANRNYFHQEIRWHNDTKAARDAALHDLAAAREALQGIADWCAAYPLTVFPEASATAALEACEAAGISVDAMHGTWARHLLEGIGRKARAALDPRA